MKNIIIAFILGFISHYIVVKTIFNTKLSKENIVVDDNTCTTDELIAHTQIASKEEVQAQKTVCAPSEYQCPVCPKLSERLSEQNQTNLDMAKVKESNSTSRSFQKIVTKFKKAASDRTFTDFKPEDAELMAQNVFSDPAYEMARAKNISEYKKISPINGIYSGHHYVFDNDSPETRAFKAKLLIDYKQNSQGILVGNYEYNVENNGSTTGNGSVADISLFSSGGYMLEFGGTRFVQILSIDKGLLKGNIYNKDKLIGYAILYKQ